MSRKTANVTLNGKDFNLKELTVGEIIELINESTLLSGKLNQGNGGGEQNAKTGQKAQEGIDDDMFKDLLELSTGLNRDLSRMMEKCCDFSISDLKPLAPSEVKQLVDVFKEMNSDFLGVLKALGLLEVILEIKEATLSSFSKTLVTSLRADM